MSSEEHWFEWRGRRIAWSRQGSGPPVVLCHGTPFSSALWAPFAEALAGEFTVHLWDMPGYGRSTKHSDHDVDLGTQGEALAALMDHWGLAAPHLVAHDYGGAVAMRAHLLHGVPVASLCLVDVVLLRPWGTPFLRLVRENTDAFAQLPAPIHRAVVESYIAGASHRRLRPEETAMLADPWTDGDGQPAFYRQIAQADERYTEELEPLLGKVDVPTQIVWGAEDAWLQPDRAHRLHEIIPGSTLELVPGAGHLIQLDAPAALATILHRWLSPADPPGATGRPGAARR